MSPHGVAGQVAENAHSTSTARATSHDNHRLPMVSGYLPGFAEPLITAGSRGGRSGRKRLFLASVGLFGAPARPQARLGDPPSSPPRGWSRMRALR